MEHINTITDNATNNETDPSLPAAYRHTLLSIYTFVLVGGTVSVGLMINILKSNVRSVTTVAVLNLIVVHILFLLTVPFRMYFYATSRWYLGIDFCNLVSGMIHGHMYIAFIFYVIILVVRYLNFFKRVNQVEFYRRLHALGASLVVWVVILGVALPITMVKYGETEDREVEETQCFQFGGALNNTTVEVFNYILSCVVILVTLALTSCQLYILGFVYRKHGKASRFHQEFSAQIKSLCFVMVMIFFFVPYHAFRIYYVSKIEYHPGLEKKNETFLAFTALSCFDMLTFLSRWTCRGCDVSCCVFFLNFEF